MMGKTKKAFLGAALFLAAAFTFSGCEKEVSSAVVEERTAEQKTKQEAEGEKDLTVAQQVKAPDKCGIEFTETKETVPDEGGNGKKTVVHVSGIAPIEVPDVEAIRLKGVKRIQMTRPMVENWLSILTGGEITSLEQREEGSAAELMRSGVLKIGDMPYTYSLDGCVQAAEGDGETAPGAPQRFAFQFDRTGLKETEEGYENLLTGERIPEAEVTDPVAGRERLAALLEKMGLSDFRVYREETEAVPYDAVSEGTDKRKAMGVFLYERMVDGVPVTYVSNFAGYPMYQKAVSDLNNGFFDQKNVWRQERLSASYMTEHLGGLLYSDPLEITEYSGEKLFLLPFEEIRRIFENTMVPLMLKTQNGLDNYGESETGSLYPDFNTADRAEVTITKIKLGYMRIREKESSTEGILIPVWDFFGTWEAYQGENRILVKQEEDCSLLTIDARDGTVIERRLGY